MGAKIIVLDHYLKGDFNNALAVASELSRKNNNAEIQVLNIYLRTNLFIFLLKWILRRKEGLFNGEIVTILIGHILFKGYTQLRSGEYLAVVSTLGRGEAPAAFLSKYLKIPSIHIGRPKRVPGDCFTVVISHPGHEPGADEMELCSPPTRISRDEISLAARHFLRNKEHQSLYTLLIGGSAPDIVYDNNYWNAVIEFINLYSETHGGQWLVSTSRRTPEVMVRKLKELQREKPDLIADITIYGDKDSPNNFHAYLGAGKLIFVTADSVSMIADALAAGVSVFALASANVRGNLRVCSFLNIQKNRGGGWKPSLLTR